MNWIGWIGYLCIGISWAEFMANGCYARDRHKIEYYEYAYHALFWPVSVIVYLIRRWKH